MSDPIRDGAHDSTMHVPREHGYQTSHCAAEIDDDHIAAHPLDVEDPYYGSLEDYGATFAVIEASLPGLHDWVDERLAERGVAG